MGGLITALNAGKTSLATNQKSIEIVGNNVANVNTKGYSRQRAELEQIPSLNFGNFFVGQGVTVANVQRDHDIFITRQMHRKNIDFGEESGRSTPLSEVERLINIGDNSIAAEIDRFFDSWQKLSTNPSGLVERDMVIQRGQLLGSAFRTTMDELNTVRGNINNTILAKIDPANEKISRIAELNERIQLVESSGQSANAARDQRDLLVEELSGLLGVRSYEDSHGMLALQLPGGLPLVQGKQAMLLQAETDGSNVNLSVQIAGTSKDIHLSNMGGEMYGLFETRDVFIGDVAADLDHLAHGISVAVNEQHRAGTGLDGSTGLAFFTDLGGVEENAARHLQVELTDSDQVAAGLSDAPGDNRNVLNIAALETDYLLDGTDTFDNFYGKVAAKVGIAVSSNKLALGGAEDAMVQLRNMRDGIAGVSLEEEMIDLIQFQRGFESSAKFLSTIDEMMGALIELKR